jgi:hypothetical protein
MNWTRLLPSAEYIYNNNRSSSTKITLFKVLYNYNPELRIDLFNTKDSTIIREIPIVLDRIIRLIKLKQYLREQLVLAQE